MSIEVCKIDECGKVACNVNGWCWGHYKRWLKYGDPESGKTQRGSGVRFITEVALPSQSEECLTWPYGSNGDGYARVQIDGRSWLVHRFVCQVIHGTPPTDKHEAAHSCGRGAQGCVNPLHLRWATAKENQIERADHGTSNRGARQWMCKLTEGDVLEIRARVAGGERDGPIAHDFAVSKSTIVNIRRGRSWGWL